MTTLTSDIKSDLKAAFPGIKFSVKKSNGQLSTQYRIVYTDGPTETKVKNVMEKYEAIRYCKASGEILEGRNTFIDIDRTAMEALGFINPRPMCNVEQFMYNKKLKEVMESITL